MKRALLVFILFSVCGVALGQRNKINLLSTFDNKTLHFGFTLGLNYLDFSVRNYEYIGENPHFVYRDWAGGPDITSRSQVRADVAKLIPGFTVGIITSLRVSQYLELRFLPGMSFGERKLKYNIEVIDNYFNFTEKQYDYSIKSTFLDFPVHFKYKAHRINNGRPYVIFGGAYRVDISKAAEQDLVGLTRNGFYGEVGAGWDTYLIFFRLSIEAKVSIGLNNQLTVGPNNTQRHYYTDALRSLHSNIFTLSFHFE
ncbi:MAG: PorT family protein [Prolixibacteraceae bacterium]|nr:PorT family protein [Prolixibacteraceae bacterium]